MALASLPGVMVDLFCGRGGWTKGFQAHGWRCIGIDLYPQPDYPGEFIQADIAHLYELPEADFYCCSSPCENFSVHGLKCFFPSPKWPWLGIALFERARQLLEATGKPYIMENVRMAQKFVGRSDYHFGSFYLWGNALGACWPWPAAELVKLQKGWGRTWIDSQGRTRTQGPTGRAGKDKQWKLAANGTLTAKAAEIPFPLSSHIARKARCL